MKSIEEIRKITEENKKEVEIPKEVEEKLEEFIITAAEVGHSYTVVMMSKRTSKTNSEAENFIIEHFHDIMEYYRKQGYAVTVSLANVGMVEYRVACISW